MKTFKSKTAIFQEMILTGKDGSQYKAYIRNNRVMLAKDVKTGRFVKLALVQSLLDALERVKALFVLLACVLANVFAFAYILQSA